MGERGINGGKVARYGEKHTKEVGRKMEKKETKEGGETGKDATRRSKTEQESEKCRSKMTKKRRRRTRTEQEMGSEN